MTFLILGRTGSGVSQLTNLLAKRNMKIADNTESITNDTDIAVIRPDELNTITANHPDTTFRIVYVEAEDIERKFNVIKQAENKLKAEEEFDKIDENEDEEFCKFEDLIEKISNCDNIDEDKTIPKNITGIYRYKNDFSETELNEYAGYIHCENIINKRLINIVKELTQANAIEHDDNNNISINRNNENIFITPEYFVSLYQHNDKIVADLMRSYLIISPRFADMDPESGIKENKI